MHKLVGMLMLGCVLLSNLSCTAGKISTVDTADIENILGKGVQCFLVPSEEYGPGTVFRIDEHKVTYIANRTIAATLQVPAPVDAAFGELSGRQHFNLGVLASTLALQSNGKNIAQANASADRTRTIEAKLEGLKLEVTDDQDIDKVLDWFSTYPNKRPQNVYYVVREAYLADAFGMKITKELTLDFGGEFNFKQAIKANPNLKYDPTASYDLTARFPSKLRVCIKPEKLVFDRAGISGPHFRTEEVKTRLTVVSDGGSDP
jgi:hypothetical protein